MKRNRVDELNSNGDIVDVTDSTSVAVQPSVSDAFDRYINGGVQRITAINFKRQLTRTLVAMAHRSQLLIQFTGEMYVLDLPSTGRAEATSPAFVVDGIDLETGEEISLVCNVVIVSSLQRAGYSVVSSREPNENKVMVTHYTPGRVLLGGQFAMRSGAIKAGKAYRDIQVVEVQVDIA